MTEGAGRHSLTTKERRERDRKIIRRAIAASILLHFLLLLVRGSVTELAINPGSLGEDLEDSSAGGAVRAIAISVQEPVVIQRPAIPIPVDFEVEVMDLEARPEIDISTIIGNLEGSTQGPGRSNGTSEGNGGRGRGGPAALIPATPRGMIIPPSHSSLRGKEVRVWVFVNDRGRVVGDSTYLEPPTDSGDLNELLLKEAADWTFNPARRAGEPVSAWFPYVISIGGEVVRRR